LAAPIWNVFVAIKECLNRGSVKQECILSHLLNIVAFEVVICTGLFFVEIVGILFWFKRSFDPLFKQGLPIVFAKPDVTFNFRRSVETESVSWFTLQTLVYEICGFQ
jgi:hypothetical protein